MAFNIYQFIVSIPLFLLLAFGLGFIINMILKTSWLPVYIYVIVVAFLVYRSGGMNAIDAVVLLAGAAGAVLSGLVIRKLRRMGYRMF